MKDRFQAKPVILNVFTIYVQSYGKGIFYWRVDQTEHYSPALTKGMINITVNAGKKFEDCFCNSVPEHVLVKRLNDNASAWSGGTNTRFSSNNQCDYILFESQKRKFLALELKTTKHNRLSYWRKDFEDKTKKQTFMIRKCQILGLEAWSKFDNTICGFVINFSSINNDTFFVYINEFLKYTNSLDKKSINYDDVLNMNPIKIGNHLLRTNYRYNVDNFLKEVC